MNPIKITVSVLIFLISCTLIPDDAVGSVGNWSSYGDMNYFNSMVGAGDYIYCGTKGGIARYNTVTGESFFYSNLDGVAGIEITALGIDNSERIWYSSYEGTIGRLSGSDWENFYELNRNNISINDFKIYGSFIWICSNIGIHKFRILEDFFVGQIDQTFERLGDLPGQSPVFTMVMKDGLIYAATTSGIAIGDTATNLALAENWEVVPLPTKVCDLIIWNDEIYCALEAVPEIYEGSVILKFVDDDFDELGLPDRKISNLFIANDTLYAMGGSGIYYWRGGTSWRSVRFSMWRQGFCAAEINGETWFGLHHGFGKVENDTIDVQVLPTPLGATFISIFIDDADNCWVGSSSGSWSHPYGGVSSFNGDRWTQYSKANTGDGIKGYDYTCISQDSNGNMWFGTYGNGIAILTPDSTWIVLDISNCPLGPSYAAAASGNLDYIVVTDIIKDNEGNIWVVTYDAINDMPLYVWLKDSTDFSLEHVPQPIAFEVNHSDFIHDYTYVYSLEITGNNTAWLGLQYDGILILDWGDSIADNTDDEWVHFTEVNGIPTGTIESLAEDREGLVWVGTTSGLAYYDYTFGFFQQVSLPDNISSQVKSIAVDNWNNKWLGTMNGVAVLYASMDSFDVIKSTFSSDANPSERQGLISDIINDIAINKRTGTVWFAVNGGICAFETGFSSISEGLDIKIYPNPYIIDYGSSDMITFAKLPADAALYIYTLSGEMVRKYDKGQVGYQAKIQWDGLNEKGELVSAGIYLVVVTSSVGTITEKFAVVR
ncbi:MAG: T9SS type A sorting domain-containing protein [Acidobacteria bacterium]|nr:T9SS type A sorting domain-containing protein [Acidobacteriota bacterium]